jgi:hypothetical protein
MAVFRFSLARKLIRTVIARSQRTARQIVSHSTEGCRTKHL